jgi:hypothetical protein
VNAEHWQFAPFGECHHLPARVRDAVDLDERIGEERDARLNSHNPPPTKINHEERKKTQKEQKRPSRSSVLRG